ncbi:MAG: PASTA domain-containing protein [Flavobacteriales bacterium]|nr:PASTA domain-containing protein [Flavobacteriales bacterium]
MKYLIIILLVVIVLLLILFRKKLRVYFAFLFTGIFILNFFIAVIAGAGAFWGLLAYLDSYTLHGEEIAVPNFYGMHVEELGSFTSEKHLRYKIVDSVYSDNSPRGTVISQMPSANSDVIESKVKPNRTIYLTVVKSGIEYKTIPEIANQSKDYAVSMLNIYGLNPVIHPVAGQHANLVYGVYYNGKEVKIGQKVPKGSEIQINVGKGTEGTPTSVPSLRCLTIDKAKVALNSYSLFLDYHCDVCLTAADTINAKIYKQVPGPVGIENSTVRTGSDLTVFASVSKSCDGSTPVSDSLSPPQNP